MKRKDPNQKIYKRGDVGVFQQMWRGGRGCPKFVPHLRGTVRYKPLPGIDSTEPLINNLSSGQSWQPFGGSRIPIPGRDCFGDFRGDGIVEPLPPSPPRPPYHVVESVGDEREREKE